MPRSLSDPVLVREDGTYLYTLPSVVDDIDLGITHVIRGEDHVVNTAPQIQLFEALGSEPPAFGHHSLLVGAEGQALSKRIRSLCHRGSARGGDRAARASRATSRRSARPTPSRRMQISTSSCDAFDFAKLSRAPARFDPAELRALNAKLLHMLPFDAVAARLRGDGDRRRRGILGSGARQSRRAWRCENWWGVVQGSVAAGHL